MVERAASEAPRVGAGSPVGLTALAGILLTLVAVAVFRGSTSDPSGVGAREPTPAAAAPEIDEEDDVDDPNEEPSAGSAQEPFEEDDPYPISPPPPPAREVYRDWYAGYEMDVPDGWVEHLDYGTYSVAPAPEKLVAYPLRTGYSPEMFTVGVTTDQRSSFRSQVKSERVNPSVSDGADVYESTLTVGHRRAVRFVVEYGAATSYGIDWDCGGCRFVHYVIDLDRDTVVRVWIEAGSPREMQRHGEMALGMIESLRRAKRHPWANDLRAFLEARVGGEGAEAWLTDAAAGYYEWTGLYAFGEGSVLDTDIDGYGVEALVSFVEAPVAAFDVRVGHRERIWLGPGRDTSGQRRDVAVLLVELIQKAGTS